jgi:hypothetical protein
MIGLPITVFVLAVCAVLIVGGIIYERRNGFGDGYFLAGAGAVALVATLVLAGLFFWPWQSEYHRWRHVDGDVEQISSRFLGNDKSTTQRFVVRRGGRRWTLRRRGGGNGPTRNAGWRHWRSRC